MPALPPGGTGRPAFHCRRLRNNAMTSAAAAPSTSTTAFTAFTAPHLSPDTHRHRYTTNQRPERHGSPWKWPDETQGSSAGNRLLTHLRAFSIVSSPWREVGPELRLCAVLRLSRLRDDGTDDFPQIPPILRMESVPKRRCRRPSLPTGVPHSFLSLSLFAPLCAAITHFMRLCVLLPQSLVCAEVVRVIHCIVWSVCSVDCSLCFFLFLFHVFCCVSKPPHSLLPLQDVVCGGAGSLRPSPAAHTLHLSAACQSAKLTVVLVSKHRCSARDLWRSAAVH